MPQISVIVPIYKVEPYLSRCIDSILNQTFSDFEIILVDDGSPDNSGKICDEYAEKDPRILVIHQENRGVSAARNTAIEWALKNSNSQWLTFIDSDDWIHPRYLELLFSAAITLGLDISACQYQKASTISSFIEVNDSNPNKMNSEKFYIENPITAVVPWCKLYKKTYFETIRYPIGIRYEDEFTTYKVLFKTPHIAYINENLYFYYTNPLGFMNSKWSPQRLDAIGAFEEQIAYFQKNGHRDALVNAKQNLLWYIASQIKITKKTDNFKAYASELKKKLRVCMKKHKKSVNLSIRTHTGIYEQAYPLLTKIFLIVVSVYQKLKPSRR